MPDPERLLAWLAGVLAEHEPGDGLSLPELARRYGSASAALLAVERGAGMVFGLSLAAESAAVLGDAGLPALRATLARLRAHIEDRHGGGGLVVIARADAALRRGPPTPDALLDALHLPGGAPPPIVTGQPGRATSTIVHCTTRCASRVVQLHNSRCPCAAHMHNDGAMPRRPKVALKRFLRVRGGIRRRRGALACRGPGVAPRLL